MKCKARVLESEENISKIELNGKKLKVGDMVTVKWGKPRSLKQNALYWRLLTWLIEEGGMKEQGYMFPEELHEALKGRLLCAKVDAKGGFKTVSIGSTTELKSDQFMEYIEKIEALLSEYCGINFYPFWQDYAHYYEGDGEL